jgi:ribosome-binding factor A
MASRRQRQVGELLHEEISRIIQHETKDPRLGFVTVTGVDVSPDLRQAQVYITVFGDKLEVKNTLAGLTSATSFFRRLLGQSLSLRHVPELTFKIDTSVAYGLHIDSLLDAIHEESDESIEIEPEDET